MLEKVTNRKRLVLLDAHAILHRGYHALPDFSTSKGEPTGALYGLSSMLLKIISDLKPDYIAACYDLPGPTYRHEAYEAYKAQRKKAEDDLVLQMTRSRDVFEAFSIPIYEMPGFEADDCLGTIVEQARKDKKLKDLDVIIASGDMDTLQLVDDERVRVYTLKKGIQDTILYDEKGVFERFGFPPALLPDFKGLRGDPSDNIIGVPGIGEKTATDLIKNFGTIEEIYKTLKKDEKSFFEKGFKERIVELLKKHEEEALFSKMLASIRRDVPIKFSLGEEWKDVASSQKIDELFSDLEFRALKSRVKTLFGEKGPTSETLPLEEVKNEINREELEELKIALFLLQTHLQEPTLEDIFHYAKTADFKKAKEIVLQSLEKNNLSFVYEKIEKPLIPIIKKMEKRGVLINVPYLKNLSKEYHKELSSIEKKIHKLAGEEFNVNSPRQLGKILFEKLSLSIKNHKKTGGGEKSTRESELEKLKDVHPIIPLVLSYRELQKLLSTYIDTIPGLVDEERRLHTHFLQTGAATGRMASQNPGLQNIPIKTELGRKIRHAFVAAKGYSLVSCDYAQIELKIAAFLSKDSKLIEIFKRGDDVHTAVASEVFGVSKDRVTKEMRRQAKVINFGILYGMGVNALRANLGSTRQEAQKFYNDYFETFSGLARYLDKVKAEAERRGYTETFFGRRRYFEAIKSKIPYIRASAERMAINAPIQGTQADIIKLAMGKIDSLVEKNKWSNDVYMILQVHDELVFEISESILEEASLEIKKIMESIVSLKDSEGITLSTSVSSGPNWGEMKTLL